MTLPSRPILVAFAVAVIVIGAPVAWYLGSPIFLRTELHEPAIEAYEPDVTPSVAASEPAATAAPVEASASSETPLSQSPTAASAVPAWTPDPPRTGRFSGTDDFHFGRGDRDPA